MSSKQVIANGDLSADIDSGALNVEDVNAIAIIASWAEVDAVPSGEIIVQAKIEGSPFDELELSEAALVSGASGSLNIILENPNFDQIKILYTRTSGNGLLNVYAKGVSKNG